MKRLLLPAALLFSLAAARADFVIEQKVDGLGQQSGSISVKIKETKARARAALDGAGARATKQAPLAWLSLEQYAPDQVPEVRLTRWPGGEKQKIALAHPHGAWIEWLGA